MKILALAVLLSLDFQNDILQSTADVLVATVDSNYSIDKKTLRKLFEKNAKVFYVREKQLGFDVKEYQFGVKRFGEFFSVRLWTYKNEALKATCFKDMRPFGEPVTEIESAVNSVTLEHLNLAHNQSFRIDANLDELNPDFSEYPASSIGFGCGIAGTMPLFGEQMLELTANNNIDELYSWTASLLTEKKVFGYIGLRILSFQGIEEVEYRLGELKPSVTFCFGCLIGPTRAVGEIIGSKELEEIIESYRNEHNTRL